MNRDFAIRWAAALRSGDYAQCRYRLHDGKGYCCLGVAELIAGNEFERKEYCGYVVKGTSNEKSLTRSTTTIAGISNDTGYIHGPNGRMTIAGRKYRSLVEANDAGRTFAEIADAIEANWERL